MADLLSIKPWILSAAIVFLIGGCSPKTSLHEAELIQLERVRTSFSEANISFIGRKQLALSEEDVAQVKSALEEANILVVSNSKRLEPLGNLYLLENGEQIATFTFLTAALIALEACIFVSDTVV